MGFRTLGIAKVRPLAGQHFGSVETKKTTIKTLGKQLQQSSCTSDTPCFASFAQAQKCYQRRYQCTRAEDFEGEPYPPAAFENCGTYTGTPRAIPSIPMGGNCAGWACCGNCSCCGTCYTANNEPFNWCSKGSFFQMVNEHYFRHSEVGCASE